MLVDDDSSKDVQTEYMIPGVEGPDSVSSILSTDSGNFSNKSRSGRFAESDVGSTKYELEDYIYEIQCRQTEAKTFSDTEQSDDTYIKLAQKEQDLILAAELGKALLERNEVLVRKNETQAEEFGHKLEVLEQEKHSQKRKFHAKEAEYDLKIQELTIDLQCAKHDLEDQHDLLNQSEKAKNKIIDELTQQNQRLSSQFKEASKREEQLNQQIRNLREQFSLKKANITDQFFTLEMLKEEINLLSEKKLELERRIDSLADEREGLSMNLDLSSDKILMLEKVSREKEQIIRNSQRDLEDLRHTNLSLNGKLEAISRNSTSPCHTSLCNEMEISDHDGCRTSLPVPNFLLDDESFECDNPILLPISDAQLLKELRQEVLEVTSQLRNLAEQVRHQRRNSLTSLSTNSSEEFNATNIKPGVLKEMATELKNLVRKLLRRDAKSQCSSCGKSGDDRIQLEQEIHNALESVDKMTVELQQTKEKLKIKTDEAARLEQSIIIKDAEKKAVDEEKENLKHDLANTHLAKDELIKKAWDMRDNAVARKNSCEIELAKARVDVMQINSQLMEAVQQKIELSQQLEMWQVDMQQLLDDQMRRKLDRLETAGVFRVNGSESDSSSSSKNTPRKTFKIFALLSHLKRNPFNNNNKQDSS